jgi:hypothetical protein
VALLAAAGALAPAFGQARAQGARSVHDSPGMAVGVEVGHYGDGYGATAAYYQPLPVPRLAVGVGAGVGLTGGSPSALAGGFNGFAAYGSEHRALLLVGYAVVDRAELDLHGTAATERSYWGPEVSAGYELLSATGPVLRLLVGVAVLPWQATEDGGRVRTTLTLAAGWKLW